MAITFRVDDVAKATDLPRTRTLAVHLRAALAFGGDAEKRVLQSLQGGPAPLLAAIHEAFAEHRPLALSPDAVWLTILSGVAQHIKLHAEELRPRLVRHQGKRDLVVQIHESLALNPAAAREAVASFRRALADEIGQGRAALLTCDFSTTTDVELAASEILLLDAYSPFFDYTVWCLCGIPELTLLGEPKDWRMIRERLDVLSELDLEWWTSSLVPIVEQLVAASEGRPDPKFFRDIYKPQEAYEGDVIVGWSARLYPYIANEGRFDLRNPLLEVPFDYRPPKPGPVSFEYEGVGIRVRDLPDGLGICTMKVQDAVIGETYSLELKGGLMGIEVDAEGRLAPFAAWTVSEVKAKANLGPLIDTLRERADFVAQPPEPPLESMGFSTRERLQLAEAFGEARLFVGKGEWRLRGRARLSSSK